MIKLKKQQGQIAIITLFSLAVFVLVGGSVITQIIFEQKKAVLEEKSRQAYFAAESGIENALQQIATNDEIIPSFNVGEASVSVNVADAVGGPIYKVPTTFYKGDSFFLNLEGYDSPTDLLQVCWDKLDTGIIVNYFYTGIDAPYSTNTYAYNSLGSSNIVGGVNSTTGTNSCGLTGTVYYQNMIFPDGEPDYLIVWVAYGNDVHVAFSARNGGTIPAQGKIITSTALVQENKNKVERGLQYFVSQNADGSALKYPPSFLTMPLFSVGGVNYQ